MKFIAFIFLLLFISCKSKSKEASHPMVDGRNLEWDHLRKESIKISEDVDLFIFQNSHYVWMAYTYPKGSFGTLDMEIETEKIKDGLNLHVSAQLGEWVIGDHENIPTSATNDLWWNNNGWTANNLWANGIDTVTYNTPELKIKNGDLRELQLSKSRFGSGEWHIRMNINAIKNKEGKFVNLSFPEDEKFYSLIIQ